jgi:hypothetical protein
VTLEVPLRIKDSIVHDSSIRLKLDSKSKRSAGNDIVNLLHPYKPKGMSGEKNTLLGI